MDDTILNKLSAKTLTSRGIKAGSEILPFNKGVTSPLVKNDKGIVYPTLIPEIDFFLPEGINGERGFPAGHFCMITGSADSCKSLVLQRIEINALNAGATVYRLERDRHFDPDMFLNGIPGIIKDTSEEALSRYKLIEVNSFDDVYQVISSILYECKEKVVALAKQRKVPPHTINYSRDIGKVLITLDSIAGLYSETSLSMEYGEGLNVNRKVAEENTDIHRILKTCKGLMQGLGIPFIFTNQFRAVIGSFGLGPKQKSYAYASLQYEVSVALEFSAWNEKARVFKGNNYRDKINLKVTSRKTKNVMSMKDGVSPIITFHKRYGFDVLAGVYNVLEYSGFLTLTTSAVVITEKNANGSSIPDELMFLVGHHDRSEMSARLKNDIEFRTNLWNSYLAAQSKIPVAWIGESMDVNINKAVFGVDVDQLDDSETPQEEASLEKSAKKPVKKPKVEGAIKERKVIKKEVKTLPEKKIEKEENQDYLVDDYVTNEEPTIDLTESVDLNDEDDVLSI